MTVKDDESYRTGFLTASFLRSDRYNVALISKRENSIGPYGELYHYTSVAGFKGIIESAGFWASDNRFLNDAEELRDGARLASNIVQHCCKRTRSLKFRSILERVHEKIADPDRASSLVVCFSRARDDLDQWRGYATPGGLCIKVRERKKDERPIFYGPYQLPFLVFYKNRMKAESILSTIRRYETEYMIDRTVMPLSWPDFQDRSYIDYLSSAILLQTSVFKNTAFSIEKEVRISIPYEKISNYGTLNFRITSLGLVPFIHTADQKGLNGLLPIEEVIVGPSSRQQLLAETVETFLRHTGYGAVKVTLSQVPFRS